MGKLWHIIEDWRDGMAFPPSFRQIAIKLGVSQSAFDTWKRPTEMPKMKNLLAISELTGVPYRYVAEAAADDIGLFDEKRVRQALANQGSGTDVQEYDATPLNAPNKPAKRRTSPSDKP